jgi:hypothetical protein
VKTNSPFAGVVEPRRGAKLLIQLLTDQMKRQCPSTTVHAYDGLFTMLFEFAGPDDEFVFAFVVNGLAHLAFVPEEDDYARPTLARIACTSKFFYRAYQKAHATIIFPELDKRFRAFAEAYEAWKPTPNPRLDPSESEKLYYFEPLQFKRHSSDLSDQGLYGPKSRPVVAKLSVLHWLAKHRYPRPMNTTSRENIDTALRSYYWISWFQSAINRDPEWNILGRPWHAHDLPTLACAAIAHSHRCVDGAMNALMWAYIDDSSREKQREFITVWIFFAMTASLLNTQCVLHGAWAGWTRDMVAADKITNRLLLNRTGYDDWGNHVVFGTVL